MEALKPIGNRVLVLPDPEVREVGGIVLPEMAKEAHVMATIVDVGCGKDIPDELRAGCRVLLPTHCKHGEHVVAGNKHWMVEASSILAIIQ